MTKRILFLFAILAAVFTISCEYEHYHFDYVKVINNSDYNITWVVLIDVETGSPILSERDDKLIAKNGGTKSYTPCELGCWDGTINLIVCVQAEDISEFMCSNVKSRCNSSEVILIWTGKDDPKWKKPQQP